MARPVDLHQYPEKLQDLPPEWARFCLEVERFVARDLGVDLRGRKLLVALSGGPDSTALFLVLHYLSERGGFTLEAAHFNHLLRPESGYDAWFADRLAESLNVVCRHEARDVAAHAREFRLGLEEAGRALRMGFLERQRLESGADCIVLGHHLDDLSEDVVLRLTRGVGWPGLGGMSGHDPGRSLLRPLLLTPKSRLLEFLVALDVTWVEDPSNEDLAFARNRARLEVIPLLTRENPSLGETVARLWRQAELDRRYFEAETGALLERALAPDLPRKKGGPVFLLAEPLGQAHPALRLRLYKTILDGLGPGQVLADTLLHLDEAFAAGRLGSVFQFPGRKQATVRSEGLQFEKVWTDQADGGGKEGAGLDAEKSAS